MPAAWRRPRLRLYPRNAPSHPPPFTASRHYHTCSFVTLTEKPKEVLTGVLADGILLG